MTNRILANQIGRYYLVMSVPFVASAAAFESLIRVGLQSSLALLASQLLWLMVSFPFVHVVFNSKIAPNLRSFLRWSITFGLSVAASQITLIVILQIFEKANWVSYLFAIGVSSSLTFVFSKFWVIGGPSHPWARCKMQAKHRYPLKFRRV